LNYLVGGDYLLEFSDQASGVVSLFGFNNDWHMIGFSVF
jgi:hypothetical protein